MDANFGRGARFHCPNCWEGLDYSEWNGKTGSCPGCKEIIRCYVVNEPASVCVLVKDETPAAWPGIDEEAGR